MHEQLLDSRMGTQLVHAWVSDQLVHHCLPEYVIAFSHYQTNDLVCDSWQ